ncbi:lantibiotic dehydratase [Virgisporangium aurantiacum]|uniref:Lantibiotic dehydratase n=1 Tax=Virgisporangium aurantiacum TaxID=175570 RepID=A0A8J4E3G2_9ACTN|nr:lantibiotic dehydratase [Virgisporangium aurantiacum]GIJ60071.1 lantibiotic dehydratase [Virgisporangium aurantiacum]
MAEPPRFTPAHVALLRVPTLPVTRSAATRVDLDLDDPERLAGFLRTVLDDPVLREAVEVSSESLARTLGRLDHRLPVEPAKLRRAALAVTRYLLRMSGRPTPFGLLAGVAVARFDDSETAGAATKVRFDTGHRKGVRPDAGWLSAVVAEWEGRSEVRRHLRVVVNDLCQIRGDRLVLPYVRRAAGTAPGERVQELSVRYTEPVRRAVTAAARPVAFRDLADRLAAAFPHAGPDRIDALLGTLVAQDILLTDLRPPLDTGDALGYVLDRLEAAGASVADLRSVAGHLARYAAEPLGAGLPAWRDAVAAMRARNTSDGATIQVDLRVDVDVTLPRAVAEEAARAAAALWRLAPGPTEPPHLAQYRAAFVEWYGLDRPVPLGELIDPERGLGAPAGYQVPPGDRTLEPVAEHASTRDEILAELVELALLDGSGEVVLTDEVIERLAGPDRHEPPPESVELSVQVLAGSTAALDDGTFRLVTGAASSTAGAIFGRFAHLFADGAYLTATAAGDPPGEPVRAQLVFAPLEPRHANVIQVPKICAETIAVGTFADRSDPTVLGLADLAVVAGRHRLALRSVRHGREIDAVSPHMLVRDYSSANAVRLIREIASSRYREFNGWSWGRVMLLSRLPRVRYGRTVLAPATWQLPERLRDKALSWPDWSRELDAWRQRWRVPDRILATTYDNRVELDLTVTLHRHLLRDETRRRPTLIVSEVLNTEAEKGWLGGHANEVVIPMAVRTAPEPARSAARTPASAPVVPARAHLPGGEWLYAKLYCGRSRHNEILGAHLPDLIERVGSDVDRWFFIRYVDPLPHLRLRFHGDPSVLNGAVLPMLHDWAAELCAAGLAGRLALDAYEPETVRYGGPDALEAAERAFAADSDAVLAQVRACDAGLDLAPDLLAAANYVDLLRALDVPDWTGWLLDEFPEGRHHAAFRRIRREALRLVDATGDAPALSDVEGGVAIRTAWQRRVPAFAAYGRRLRALGDTERGTALAALLHMHHNRLVGIDPESEARSLAIARGAVAAHLDRARFGS